MKHLEGCGETIKYLQGKVEDLENELERKDKMHLQDLTLMRDQMQAIMNKYCLN